MNQQAEPFLSVAADAERDAFRQVHVSRPHESAHLHVSGRATYIDDIPLVAGTLHAALGLSAKPHARIASMRLDAVRAAAGVVAVLTAADIPGTNDCGPIVHDDPVLADGVVQYVGQPMFVVVATSHDAARRAARLAQIEYEERPAILTAQAARAADSYVLPPMRLARGDAAARIAHAAHRDAGELTLGGQEQFYLEGQIAYAVPKEDGAMHVYSSTQHPSEMQHLVAHALGLASHDVLVECRRMGAASAARNRNRACSHAAPRSPHGSCNAR
ncbi:Aldehyde oxidase/xanthine dehydrogenase a/b hammerhead domain-containing protein [Burkholderia pseudomallei]